MGITTISYLGNEAAFELDVLLHHAMNESSESAVHSLFRLESCPSILHRQSSSASDKTIACSNLSLIEIGWLTYREIILDIGQT